jgi:5'-nucleotidase / UDP-sugar diphosphatase
MNSTTESYVKSVRQLGAVLGILWLSQASALAGVAADSAGTEEAVSVTVLHTNDLHSHYRPEKTTLGLGGIARLKTLIQGLRQKLPHTLLVDSGDWSEGTFYYTEGGGYEDLRMMDRLGYDFAIIGNHDWLNGPSHLLNILRDASSRTKFVASNLSTETYERSKEFSEHVSPYEIVQIQGIKIGIIGLSPYEWIFDKYFSPVEIREPFLSTRRLSAQLKKQVDAVIVLSHNSVTANQAILKFAPAVDLIIGAHDHKKLTTPVVVHRFGHKPGWVVEAGSWGRYLGRVDLKISKQNVDLIHYELIQVDKTIPEDPEIRAEIEKIEQRVERRYGPVFHDHVGESEISLSRYGSENWMGDLVTDSYIDATQAEVALESTKFISGEIHKGLLTSADIFNAHPLIYNTETEKNWTLMTLPMRGVYLKRLFNVLLFSKKLSLLELVSASGLNIVYGVRANANQDYVLPPSIQFLSRLFLEGANRFSTIVDFKVNGRPLDEDQTYRVATSTNFIEAIRFINSLYDQKVPLDGLRDTGWENWRLLRDYIHARSPLTVEKINYGERIRKVQPDLKVYAHDIELVPLAMTPEGLDAEVNVKVKNYGMTPSPRGVQAHLLWNKNAARTNIDPEYTPLGVPNSLSQLYPGAYEVTHWRVTLPEADGFYALEIRIDDDLATRLFTRDEVQTLLQKRHRLPLNQSSGPKVLH